MSSIEIRRLETRLARVVINYAYIMQIIKYNPFMVASQIDDWYFTVL